MDVASNKSKDDTKTAVKQKKNKQSMYKTRQPLFTGCNGPVCAQHGCEQDVIGTAMASRACRAGNIMEAKFGPKMGHFGHSSARHIR